MSNIDKRALREAANAANSASWGNWESYKPHKGSRGYEVKVGVRAVAQHCLKVDAAFIAAANPAVVLALLDEMEAAEHTAAVDHEAACSLVEENEEVKRKLAAAAQRIAELEARTVNLPKRNVGEVMHMSGFSRDYAEGWCAGNDNAIHEIHAAGMKVAAGIGKGNKYVE